MLVVGGTVGVGVADGVAVGCGVVVGLGVLVGIGVAVGVGLGVDVGVAVGLGVDVGAGVGFPACGGVTVGKSKRKDWYRGMLLRFSFIHTVLPIPIFAHWDRNWLSSLTVDVVKLLYSLKSAPTSVFMSLMPLDWAVCICDMAPDGLQLLK